MFDIIKHYDKVSEEMVEQYSQLAFDDVSMDDYYYDAVLWASRNEITTGTSSTTFSPSETVDRAQAVTFLWRSQGCPEPEASTSGFSDVVAGSWYEQAVIWAVEKGLYCAI